MTEPTPERRPAERPALPADGGATGARAQADGGRDPGARAPGWRPFALVLRAPGDARRHAVALAGVWALAAASLWIVSLSALGSILFFVVYPLLWAVCRTRRRGVLATLVYSAGIAAAYGLGRGGWADGAVNGGLSCAFSLLMGLWFWKVYETSGELAAALEREREAREELRGAQADLVEAERAAARTSERERWARDVHDTLAQGFVSVIALAQAARGELSPAGAGPEADDPVARRLDQIETIARDNLAEARALVAGEDPALLRDGLADALGRLVAAQRAQGRATSLDAVPSVLAGLSRATEVAVLRTVQEALSNVSRHSGAGGVEVSLGRDPTLGELVVRVEDDGGGTQGRPEGVGLTGMRARVEAVGGTVTVDPAHAPDAGGSTGTLVEVRIPQ